MEIVKKNMSVKERQNDYVKGRMKDYARKIEKTVSLGGVSFKDQLFDANSVKSMLKSLSESITPSHTEETHLYGQISNT